MQDIPDKRTRAAPQDRQQEAEAHDKPLAMSYQLVVLFVARAGTNPAGNYEVGALLEQRAELEHGLRIDRALGMKEDERVGGAVIERAPVRAVVGRQVLVVNGDSATAQVLDCSIGAAAINREHLGAGLRRCYEALIDLGVVGREELTLVNAWLADLRGLGVVGA